MGMDHRSTIDMVPFINIQPPPRVKIPGFNRQPKREEWVFIIVSSGLYLY